MVGSKKKNIAATILGKVALNSAKAAADSRCMYCLHQPKQPAGIKKPGCILNFCILPVHCSVNEVTLSSCAPMSIRHFRL